MSAGRGCEASGRGVGIWVGVVALVWGALAGGMGAQLIDRAHAPKPAPEWLTLDVVARDRAGAAVGGLGEGDFALYESGKPRGIEEFRRREGAAAPEPTRVVMVLDAVNTTYATIAFERAEIDRFLHRNGGRLPLATSLLVLTDTSLRTVHPTTLDGGATAKSLDGYSVPVRTVRSAAGLQGAVEQYEISLAGLMQIALAAKAQPGRKLLVWMSPGWPSLSTAGVVLPPRSQRQLFLSIVALSTALREAHITLYSVDPLGAAGSPLSRANFYRGFTKGATAADEVVTAQLELQVLAAQTGGRAMSSSNDVAGMIDACYADARWYYEVRFVPKAGTRPNEYRTLEVRSSRPGVTMQTRTGYYAQP